MSPKYPPSRIFISLKLSSMFCLFCFLIKETYRVLSGGKKQLCVITRLLINPSKSLSSAYKLDIQLDTSKDTQQEKGHCYGYFRRSARTAYFISFSQNKFGLLSRMIIITVRSQQLVQLWVLESWNSKIIQTVQ